MKSIIWSGDKLGYKTYVLQGGKTITIQMKNDRNNKNDKRKYPNNAMPFFGEKVMNHIRNYLKQVLIDILRHETATKELYEGYIR